MGIGVCVRPGGFLDRWLQFCEPFEFPDSFALFSMLACASAAIDRRIRVNPGNEPSPYPALYVVLYGPSGVKKGGAIKYATWLFSKAVSVTRYPDDFTMEALFGRLAADSMDGGPGARGIVVNEEFADLIGGADYALRTTAMLSKLWDCRAVTSRETRGHGYEEVRDAYVTLLGSTSPDWLEYIDPRVLAGGFVRRLLLVVEFVAKKRAARQVLDVYLFDALIEDFRDRLGTRAFPVETAMTLTPEAGDLMEQWYDALPTQDWPKRDDRARKFATTVQEHVLRVAACVQVLEGGSPGVLDAESWNEARALVEYIIPGLLLAYQSLVPTPFARLKAMAVRIVAEAGGEMDPAELDRALTRSGGVDQEGAGRVRAAAVFGGSLRWAGARVALAERE